MAGKQQQQQRSISRSDGGIDTRASPDPVRYFDSPSPSTSDDGNYETGSALMCSEDEDEDCEVLAELNRIRIRGYWASLVDHVFDKNEGWTLETTSGGQLRVYNRDWMMNSGKLQDLFADLVLEAVCK